MNTTILMDKILGYKNFLQNTLNLPEVTHPKHRRPIPTVGDTQNLLM